MTTKEKETPSANDAESSTHTYSTMAARDLRVLHSHANTPPEQSEFVERDVYLHFAPDGAGCINMHLSERALPGYESLNDRIRKIGADPATSSLASLLQNCLDNAKSADDKIVKIDSTWFKQNGSSSSHDDTKPIKEVVVVC